MYEIILENFRCFRDEQTARLAPLTLLVGENSTGKTSFLAMIKALLDIAIDFRNPDFKEDPYDLGSFDEIAHHRGTKGGRADTFKAGFSVMEPNLGDDSAENIPRQFSVTFGKMGTTPTPVRRQQAMGDIWTDEHFESGQPFILRFGTSRGSWERRKLPVDVSGTFDFETDVGRSFMMYFAPRLLFSEAQRAGLSEFVPLSGSPPLSSEDEEMGRRLMFSGFRSFRTLSFASAPVRSKPRRTYDPSRSIPDPEGEYVPMFLANMFFQNKKVWGALKKQLEEFGKAAGLFDEISIRPLGNRESEPFQLQVRRFGKRLRGPQRNLIDMGYGVSQVLPLITELLRPDAPSMFLLQQPEVHLHPSAQAALGTLFCQVASPDRQLIVETHSDHLLDRIRMDVRDGTTGLKPDDVSILFFERGDLDVRIHSLRIDEEGNILGAPDGYRSFFLEETARSLWKRQSIRT